MYFIRVFHGVSRRREFGGQNEEGETCSFMPQQTCNRCSDHAFLAMSFHSKQQKVLNNWALPYREKKIYKESRPSRVSHNISDTDAFLLCGRLLSSLGSFVVQKGCCPDKYCFFPKAGRMERRKACFSLLLRDASGLKCCHMGSHSCKGYWEM